MLAKKLFIALAATGLVSLTVSQGWATTATTSTSPVASKTVASDELVSRYAKLAGSTTNAQSLVTGLRNGTLVTLAPSATAPAGTPLASFTPTTQPMGYGNIKIALSLARTTLAKQGITNPTPEQLAAALNGGNITLTNGTTVTLVGVLTQRSAGMGWGKIAQNSGAKVGGVVSASKTDTERKEDKKITLVKARDTAKDMAKDSDKDDDSKNRSSTGDDSTSRVKSSSSSSSSSSASTQSSGNSSGGSSSHSSNGGGSKSNGGGGSSSSNSGGNGGGNGGGNSGGNGGGGKK